MKDPLFITDEIKYAIVEFLEGTIETERLNRLNSWLKESQEHQIQFNDFKKAWYLSGKAKPVPEERALTSWPRVKNALELKKDKKVSRFWTTSKVAASWFLVFILGGAFSALLIRHMSVLNYQQSKTTITVPLGSKSLVDLPDGTKVWLNAGSKLTYTKDYGKSTREVLLSGEAYFSVKSNKKVPFLVKTSHLVVKALGTKFNVKAYPDEKIITTTLEEGKIELSLIKGVVHSKAIILKPREMAIFYRPETGKHLEANPPSGLKVNHGPETEKLEIVTSIHTELETSWKDDTWTIDEETLGNLAPILERRYNMIIEFESEEIKSFHFTGKIQNETIEEIMSAIELSAPVKYNIEKNKIILSLNKNFQE